MKPRAPGPLVGLLLLLAALSATYVLHRPRSTNADSGVITAVPSGSSASFDLVDSRVQPVSDRDFRGKWLLVFFGYTHCPDVCPTTLSDMGEVLTQLGPLSSSVQPLFVTVDPERDTPRALADYMTAFDPRILALTGTPDQIARAAKAYHVYYERRQIGDDYSVDHSAIIHVVRPGGTYARSFFTTDGPLEVAKRLRELIASGTSRRPAEDAARSGPPGTASGVIGVSRGSRPAGPLP